MGPAVQQFSVGDVAAIEYMIDSCRTCEPCRKGEENYCEGPNSWLATYNGPMVPASKSPTGDNMYGRDNTFGGYSNVLVVHEDFVIRIPEKLSPAAAAPIVCAGVTTYSPMKEWGVGPGHRVGIVGYGGLGHMATKIAMALGADVTVFSSSTEKVAELVAAGQDAVHEGDSERLTALARGFDFILSTIPEKHDVNPFVLLLKHDGVLCVVGALEPLAPVNNQAIAFQRRRVSGSLIGSIAETKEVLAFCAEHGIAPEIEIIPIQQINDAYGKVESGEVRYRYVIDMATLKTDDDS